MRAPGTRTVASLGLAGIFLFLPLAIVCGIVLFRRGERWIGAAMATIALVAWVGFTISLIGPANV